MNIVHNAERQVGTGFATSPGVSEDGANGKLEVNVIYTTDRATLAALKAAGELAVDLGARVNLVVPKEVPWTLPLTRPPVATQWIEQHLFDLVSEGSRGFSDISIYVLLCRSKLHALMKALKPKSLVVIGGKMPWWPFGAARMAKMLEQHGYRVIFAAQR